MAVINLRGNNDSYQFDPEDLGSIIGKGGMGVVFKGLSVSTKMPVAIKVLYREITFNISNIERERQSANIKIHHQNLVEVLDFIELDGIYHIITEFLEGESLNKYLEGKSSEESGRRLSELECRAIIKSTLKGLAELHKNGIIHRDIDPSNIFLCHNGGVKIMDFGIAKITGDRKKSFTGIGTMVGKPHYSPPEQIKGESEKICPASDLYSLGITIYEMLTGSPPFNVTNEYELMRMQIEAPIPKNALIHDSLFTIIQKATEKDPKNRFQSCEEFANALDSINYTTTIPIRKSKKWVPIFFISVIIIIGLTVTGLIRSKSPQFYYKQSFKKYQIEDFNGTFSSLNKAIQLESNFFPAIYARGILYYNYYEKYDLAVSDFTKCININPEIKELFILRGLAYSQQDKQQEAIRDFSEYIKYFPDSVDVYFYRAMSRSEIGDRFGAIADYDEIIKRQNYVKPRKALMGTVYNNKAYSLVELGLYNSALPIVNYALNLEPKESYIWGTRGELYYHIHEYESCISDMTKAIELEENRETKADSDDPGVPFYFRGLSEIHLGRRVEGCKDLEKALELGMSEAIDYLSKYCK